METTEQTKTERLADDLLVGAPAIAEFLGMTEKAVYHLASKKRIPVGKMGKNLIARRSALKRAIVSMTS